jgi:hypothetical protein
LFDPGAAGAPARLGPACRARDEALPEGPVFAAFHEVDFATARRACPRTELGLGGRGAAIIDTPNFYGMLAADALLFGSWALSDRTELFATAELVHWTFAQNATLKGTTLGLGQLSVGASRVLVSDELLQLSPSVRLMLPTATGETGVHTVGLEAGVAAAMRPLGQLELHGYAGADLGFGVFSPAPAQGRLGALLVVGVQYSPWRWVGVALDLDAHLGHRAALDYLAPALALRFGIGSGLGIDLSVSAPIAGADRHDFAGALRLTYRLGT